MVRLYASSLITLGILLSFVLFIVMAALLFVDMVSLPFAIGLTVAINFLLWIIGPKLTDLLMTWLYGARFWSREELLRTHPEVVGLFDTICQKYNFPFPKFAIIADGNPTAFTYGSGRFNSRVVVTEGLFQYLSPSEVQAVLAHESGHIVNRDFVVMMVASTLVQILYELYAYLNRARGKNSEKIRAVAVVAYVLYWIGSYLLLYLSRTREYLADAFAAQHTKANLLASALIKIAYGIAEAADTNSSKRLLESTRHLGITDVKTSNQLGAATAVASQSPELLAEIVAFDKFSPWAKLMEINSTHPLTGNRLSGLGRLARELQQPFDFDISAAISRLNIDKGRLYRDFALGALVYFAPALAVILGLLFLPLKVIPGAVGLVMMWQLLYKFPFGQCEETTILQEMRNPYASPMRGKPIALRGQVVGRGMPGYVFSEDMMYQDRTGLTFLDYVSAFSFIGDLFFALSKVKQLIGAPSTVEGWFFRGMGSQVSLKSISTQSETISSHPMLWSLLIPALLIAGSVVLCLL